MSDILYTGGEKRQEAFKKLKVFLLNPGMFSLMVVGSRGSGKHYAIESAFDDNSKSLNTKDKETLCAKKLVFISEVEIATEKKELNALLKKNEFNTLVIEDVEKLSAEQQDILFNALSTTDGRFGIGEKFNVRIVFTSSKDLELLRTGEADLTGLFWDRISQLIIEFPSFKMESSDILNDFYETWKKMKFFTIEKYKSLSGVPKNVTLEKFLEDNANQFDGGFRDLDKIACLYFNYRIFHYEEKKKIIEETEKLVMKSVVNDFIGKSQLQDNASNDYSIFRFDDGLNKDQLLAKYKIQLRNWAVKKFHSVANAEKKLGFKPGSMKNYVEGKATQLQKKEMQLINIKRSKKK